MRLIDADALSARMYHDAFEIDSDLQKWDGGCWIRYKMFENAIADAPTIEERKTGKWIIDDDWNMCDIEGTLVGTKEFECDKCGYRELVFDGIVTHLNYCPNCGADMRGDT